MMVQNNDMRVAHSFVLQFWIYEYIIVVQPRELHLHNIALDNPTWYQ